VLRARTRLLQPRGSIGLCQPHHPASTPQAILWPVVEQLLDDRGRARTDGLGLQQDALPRKDHPGHFVGR